MVSVASTSPNLQGGSLMRRLTSVCLGLTLLALAACASPVSEPTPDIPATVTAQVQTHLAALPTAAPLPTHTPYPTNTPYPTLTPAPTATAYPTATPRPTYTPYPTSTPTPIATLTQTTTPTVTPAPTITPTATPWPTPTAVSHSEWVRYKPNDDYSIQLPPDWEKFFDSADGAYLDKGLALVGFQSPGDYAKVAIFSIFSELGWQEDFNIDLKVSLDLKLREDELSYRTVAIWPVSTTTKRSSYEYDGQGGQCDIEGHGLHILVGDYSYFVRVEICTDSKEKFDEAFAESVFAGFTYQ